MKILRNLERELTELAASLLGKPLTTALGLVDVENMEIVGVGCDMDEKRSRSNESANLQCFIPFLSAAADHRFCQRNNINKEQNRLTCFSQR